METLGAENLDWLMENDKDLKVFLPPAQEEGFRKLAHHFSFVPRAITDEDLTNMLPSWAREIVEAQERNKQWWIRQIAWIRGFFAGGEHV